MKKLSKVFLVPLILAMFIPISIFADTQCYCDDNDQPYWGEAVIDGNINDWDLNATFFDVLWLAGSPDKPVTAKLYMMFEYVSKTMSILVVNEPGYNTFPKPGDWSQSKYNEEFWVKYLNGALIIDANSSDFAFTSNGWEAKFHYNYCDCYAIKVHHLQDCDNDWWYNDDGIFCECDGETSANYEVEVFIDCSLPVELSSFTATNSINGVELNWVTESEIENQGFLLERRTNDEEWQEIATFLNDDELRGQGTVTYKTEYSFIDNLVMRGETYEYRLADIDYNGTITYHNTREITVDIIEASNSKNIMLKPAYPNPFNPSTIIEYGILNDGMVDVSIFDLTGQKITTLSNNIQKSGWHKVEWNGTNQKGKQMPAGVYLVSVTAGNSIKTMKLILVK